MREEGPEMSPEETGSPGSRLQRGVSEPGPATHLQKGGRMIFLQYQKIPLSTDIFLEKMTPYS